jgi:hypothetical protein
MHMGLLLPTNSNVEFHGSGYSKQCKLVVCACMQALNTRPMTVVGTWWWSTCCLLMMVMTVVMLTLLMLMTSWMSNHLCHTPLRWLDRTTTLFVMARLLLRHRGMTMQVGHAVCDNTLMMMMGLAMTTWHCTSW